MSDDRRPRLRSLTTSRAVAGVIAGGGTVLAAAGIAAFVGGSIVAGLAIAGVLIIVGGFCLAIVRLAHLIRAVDERARTGFASGAGGGAVERLALKSIIADQRVSTRLTKRLSENAERGIRLALVTDTTALNGYSEVDRGLIVAILGLAPQRVILAGTPDEIATHTQVLAEVSPATTVLALPAAELRGAFLDQLAAEGRTRKAPTPVLAALTETALRDLVWGETAELVMERWRVDEFLVLASPEHRAALRDAPPTAVVRATVVGSAAIIVAALRG